MTRESVSRFAQTVVPTAIIDSLGLAAVASISYGAWLAWAPAGFIVGGSIVLALVYLISAARTRPVEGR